ncbi:arylsulfatase [Persicobacter diffluens]|uniref:N-acetylgalactosamine-6-sulfatase n=1 Tax=Persicobacter diffluens TaxID=981 RepID=A0AAN4W4Y7_9BACT|nr:N-acetylgalactosamine-6-sulfatase [Persicobacter diffluens]
MKKLIWLILGIAACNPKVNTSEERPNIILILADDMGYGDLGCYGQEKFRTPHIDQLAAEGIQFMDHYAGSTVCAPSRSVLMTGMHTGHTTVRGNVDNPNGAGQLPLQSTDTTIAYYLKKAGYATAAFGKWGLGNPETTGSPLRHGFDQFYGYYDQVLAHNSYPEFLYRNDQKEYLNNKVGYLSKEEWHKGLGSVSLEKNEYSGDLIFNEMLQYIETNKDRPFFIYHPTTIPHDNGEAPLGQRFEVPKADQYQKENWPQDEKTYAALVEYLDGQVGTLTQKLEQLGIADNTIIIFTSDNGPLATTHIDSNGPLKGGKRDMYEGGLRIPLIVKWPGKIKEGIQSNHASAFWDFLPTLCEIAGVQDYQPNDGISFLPTLLGKKQPVHDYLYWEFHWWNPSRKAVRIGDWKAVWNHPEEDVELYDLSQDIGEANNVAQQHQDIVAKAQKIMEEASVESPYF